MRPCEQLAPALEKAVANSGGKVALVKMNIDERRFPRSGPARHPVDPGRDRLRQGPAGQRDCRRAAGKPDPAASSSGWSGRSRTNRRRCWLRRTKRPPRATQRRRSIPKFWPMTRARPKRSAVSPSSTSRPDVWTKRRPCWRRRGGGARPGRTRRSFQLGGVRLAEQTSNVGELAPLEQAIAANPDNHQARFDLAVALSAKGEHDAAADHLLEIIRRDRKWNDEAARKQLLQLFEAWGLMDPASVATRRKLSAIWF